MFPPRMTLIANAAGLSALIFFSQSLLSGWGADERVLHVANGLLLLLSLVNLSILEKGLKNKNPHVFVRSVMGGMLLKMAVLLTAIMIYAGLSEKPVNKYSVLISLAFYLIYLVLELGISLKLNKKSNA